MTDPIDLGSLEYKAEDFKIEWKPPDGGALIHDKIVSQFIADTANRLLRERLAKCPEAFGMWCCGNEHRSSESHWDWVSGLPKQKWDTHYARLCCIQPLKGEKE